MAENLILSLIELPKYKPVLVDCLSKLLEGFIDYDKLTHEERNEECSNSSRYSV